MSNVHQALCLASGTMLVLGGLGGSSLKNDVWKSTNNGASWQSVALTSGWSVRAAFQALELSNGDLLVIGGVHHPGG